MKKIIVDGKEMEISEECYQRLKEESKGEIQHQHTWTSMTMTVKNLGDGYAQPICYILCGTCGEISEREQPWFC